MKKIATNKTFSFIISIVFTCISAFIMAVGVKVFISPNSFLSTGVTGIAIVIGRLYDNITQSQMETLITGILLFVFNIPILFVAWKKLSHKFAILTAINVIVNSVTLALLPDNLNETLKLVVDPHNGGISFLDAALFVGMMNGTANAFAYVVGGSTGGIDVLSMYYSLKKQFSIGKITTIINAFILFVGIFVDNSGNAISKTFYTLVYLVVNSIVIDLFYVRNKRTVLLITTSKGDEVAHEITSHFVRGVTILDAKGAYTGEPKKVLYCACSSFEVVEITKTIKSIDEHAFISVMEANKVHGNFLSKELR